MPRLTVNLGLRYEYNSPKYNSPQYDIHNEIIGFFGAGAQSSFLNRPNLIGPIKLLNPRQVTSYSASAANCSGQSPDADGNISGNFWFDPTAFDCTFNSDGHLAPGSLASFGNLGRNVFRGPGINNWDTSFLKRTKFIESKSLEFRAELFNAFDHAQFLNPTNAGFNGTFSQIS